MNTDGIIGHKKQITNLKYLIERDCIPQAILFTGPSGIGKKIIAKRFLNALFCKSKIPPCLSCPVCNQVANGSFPDFIEIIPNEKGIIPIGSEGKLENGSIRWLIDRLSRKSFHGKTGIIIDGVDKITEEGQNALLKTIEEPSLGAYFILISSNRSTLLPTILSRCSEIRFYPLPNNVIKDMLDKKGLPEPDSDFIAKISGGSLEIASILSSGDTMKKILAICSEISSFLRTESIPDIDLEALQKEIGFNQLLDIIISIFRQNLLSLIRKEKSINPYIEDLFIEDTQDILNIIKIFIALKKSKTQNLNIRHTIKGMLYSLRTGCIYNIPFANYSSTVFGG